MADRVIFHCDLNCFFASVELLDKPALREVPVAVCGDPASRHGIILAKNEPAKRRGVQTAETVWQARQKCPNLILLPPHHGLYAQYSRRINTIYGQYTDLVEPFGIDESWLDVTGSLHLFGGDARQLADDIRARLRQEVGLTISVGVSFNKVFAKLGSDYKKPDAVTVFGRDKMESVIWQLPAGDMLLVGPTTQRTLAKYGVATIGDIARLDVKVLQRLLGRLGETLWRYANGLDDSPVRKAGQAEEVKTVGNSTTLPRDVTSEEEIRRTLLELAESVGARLRRMGLKAGEVQIAVRGGDFQEIQRQRKLDPPACDSQTLYRAALDLYRRENKHWPVRLLGVRAGRLTGDGEEQTSLFGEEDRERLERLESAVDLVRERFGKGSVARALSLEKEEKRDG